MNFYSKLQQETQSARQQLYNAPQLYDGLNGNISRETYIAYLTQAYHHVSHTVSFLMAMGHQLPTEKRYLHRAIADYISEELGHEEWILNDISACGGDREAAQSSTPNLETQVLIAYNYNYIQRHNPVGFLGMVFMLESTSSQWASQGATALKKTLGLTDNAFSYLDSHGTLDIEHMQFFEKTVNTIIDINDQQAIIDVAKNTFRLFTNILLSLPHQRGNTDAA